MEAGQPARLRPLKPAFRLRSFLVALTFLSLTLGCSKQGWLARIYMVKAEEAFTKGYALRVRKDVPSEERLRYFRRACEFFSKAYRIDPDVFTLNRITSAVDACLRVEDFEKEDIFRRLEEEYVRAHPDEAKYGEAGAFMSLE